MLDRSIEWAVSILAIWKIGAIYVPIDADVPVHRFEAIVSKAMCRHVVYLANQEINKSIFLRQDITFLDYALLTKETDENVLITSMADPEDVSYILFTSGTTGEPKGAMIKHKGMLNHLLAKKLDLNLQESDMIVQNASKSFDISIWQLVETLIIGATTIIVPNDIIINVESFVNLIIENRTTILETVPSYLEVMIDYCINHKIILHDLRFIIVTGEPFKKKLAEDWFSIYPNIKMVNAYGPTEASDDITHYILDEVPKTNNVLVGKPIINTRIDILDSCSNIVPIGSAGQLYVTGIAVGGGYVGNEEQTDKVFSERLVNGHIERTYATGDIGRYLPDGNIELYGRVDDQVKVRGFRIELDEIENNILKTGKISQVVVLVNRTANGNELVAFIKGNIPINITEINEYLSKRMPYYMIPKKYITVEEMPVTKNGKLDKKKLLKSISNIANGEKDIVQPVTENEIKLANLIREILNVDTISMTNNFFELGGNSLLAMKLVIKLNSELNVVDIINNPQISNMAQVLNDESISKSSYLIPFRNNVYTNKIFIGIPYAGGNAMAFDNTYEVLHKDKSDISMFTLNMERNEDIDRIISGTVDEVKQQWEPDMKICIWGHCSGTAIALELARQFNSIGIPIEMVFIGGKLLKESESYKESNILLEKMTDSEVKEWLINQTNFEGFDNSNSTIVSNVVKHFRRDSYWCNKYLEDLFEKEFFNIPITTVYSNDDLLTQGYDEKYTNWYKITKCLSCYSINKNKGHYFIATAADDVAEIISTIMK